MRLQRILIGVIPVVLVGLYTFSFVAVAKQSLSCHLLNRSGALLCALGAAMVIYQVTIEERIATREAEERSAFDLLSPQNKDLAERIIASRNAKMRQRRWRIVMLIAFVVFSGEMLHGWGDLFMQAIGCAGVEK